MCPSVPGNCNPLNPPNPPSQGEIEQIQKLANTFSPPKPLVLTEWLARPAQPLASAYPVILKGKVAAYNWALVFVNCSTGWAKPVGPGDPPFQGMIWPNGTVFDDMEEGECMRTQCTTLRCKHGVHFIFYLFLMRFDESRELARPEPSLIDALGLGRHWPVSCTPHVHPAWPGAADNAPIPLFRWTSVRPPFLGGVYIVIGRGGGQQQRNCVS